MSSGPSVYVTSEVATRAQVLIVKGTGSSCREGKLKRIMQPFMALIRRLGIYKGVELLLKSDLSISCDPNGPFPPPGASNAGALVQRGLKVLSDSPTEALGVQRGADIGTIRKAYKKVLIFESDGYNIYAYSFSCGRWL